MSALSLATPVRDKTIAEAAAFLNLSKGRVHQLVTSGKLPARRAGNIWLINRRTLEAFAKKERRPGRPRGYKAAPRQLTLVP